MLFGLSPGLFAGGLGLDRGIVQAGHGIQQSALQAVRGHTAFRKGEQEFVDLGLQLLVQSKAGVHLLEQLKDLRFVLHDPAQVDLGVADAFGVLDIVIPGIGDGNEHLRVFEIPHVEEQILRPMDIGRKAKLVFRDDLPAVEFVPQHAVVKGGRLLHQAAGVVLPAVNALRQKAVFVHLDLGRFRLDAQRFLQCFQRVPGLAGVGGDHHPVRGDHQIRAVLQGGLHKFLGVIGVQNIIAVRKLDIVALRKGKPGVPRAGNALVLLIHHHETGILCPELLADGKAVVRRAIIQHDDLQLLIGLAADAFQTAGKPLLGVVHGHDDADERIRHDRASFFTTGFEYYYYHTPAPPGLQERCAGKYYTCAQSSAVQSGRNWSHTRRRAGASAALETS